MKVKTVLLSAMIIALCISNYLLISEYFNEYDPDNFGIKKLLNKKYRCIRFFHDKGIDKYTYRSCKAYEHDYGAFILEKSRYIYMYYAHNLILISLFAIFYLVI